MKIKKSKLSVFVKFVLVLGICCLNSGCMLNGGNVADDFSADAGVASSGEYMVRMESSFGEPKMYRGTISKPMTVQDALVASGAMRKYRNMEINVLRELPGSPRPIKMKVDFEPKRKAVTVGQDYAIHPGDRISVRASEDGIIGRMLNMTFSN